MPDTNPTTAASEAIDWLVGRMRWERILRELHAQAEGAEAVVPAAAIAELVDPATGGSTENSAIDETATEEAAGEEAA